eukprot:6204545-Pleurochrysis_carterae.AAC.3
MHVDGQSGGFDRTSIRADPLATMRAAARSRDPVYSRRAFTIHRLSASSSFAIVRGVGAR